MFSLATIQLLTALLPVVLSQNGGSDSGDYVQELVGHLNDLGYTQAANYLSSAHQTDSGRQWTSRLHDGNYTVFVPTDEAFNKSSKPISEDTDLASQYLSYHFVHGDFLNTTANSSDSGNSSGGPAGGISTLVSTATQTSSQFSTQTATLTESISTTTDTTVVIQSTSETTTTTLAAAALAWYLQQDDHNDRDHGYSNESIMAGIYPNVTIGRTLLNSSTFVELEGNKSQVLAWTRRPDGNVTILNQITDNAMPSQKITVTNSSTFKNLFINAIDGVIAPPGNLTTALTAINATSFLDFTSHITEPSRNGTNTSAIQRLQAEPGLTILVPNDQAFQEAQQSIGQYQNNQTALTSILGNHVINGTTIYSPDIQNATASGSTIDFVTAAGERIAFSSNSSGVFVHNQDGSSAEIVRPDVLVENGVIHVIGNFLLDTDADPQVASSAYESATSVASAMSSTDTLPIGAGYATLTNSSPSPSQSSSASSSPSSSESQSSSSSSESISTSESESSTPTPTSTSTELVTSSPTSTSTELVTSSPSTDTPTPSPTPQTTVVVTMTSAAQLRYRRQD